MGDQNVYPGPIDNSGLLKGNLLVFGILKNFWNSFKIEVESILKVN